MLEERQTDEMRKGP